MCSCAMFDLPILMHWKWPLRPPPPPQQVKVQAVGRLSIDFDDTNGWYFPVNVDIYHDLIYTWY